MTPMAWVMRWTQLPFLSCGRGACGLGNTDPGEQSCSSLLSGGGMQRREMGNEGMNHKVPCESR